MPGRRRAPTLPLAIASLLAAWGVPSMGAGVPPALRAEAAALRDRAMAGTQAFDLVRGLVTEAGPRSAGSRGDRLAIDWAERTMTALRLDDVRTEPVTVPHWERGVAQASIVAPWPQPLVLAALGGSIGTPEEGIEAEVIAFPSLDELEKADPARLGGAIAYVGLRMNRTPDGADYGRVVRARSAGAVAASRAGAVALLIRSVGTDQSRHPHTGGMSYDDAVRKIPAAALSNPDADLLESQLAAGRPVRVWLKLGCRTLPDATSANVIGEIRGREKPEEVVLLAAHLDSWDLGLGAIDDGAGCAIVLQAARLMASMPRRPRRTVRVVLCANEEFGLSGAREYARRHDWEPHQAATEADFGGGRVWRLDAQVAAQDDAVVDALLSVLQPIGVERGASEGGGADLIPLGPCRIPILSLVQDGTLYFDVHHTANDTLDKVDARDLDQNVAAMAAMAWILADMPDTLARVPPKD